MAFPWGVAFGRDAAKLRLEVGDTRRALPGRGAPGPVRCHLQHPTPRRAARIAARTRVGKGGGDTRGPPEQRARSGGRSRTAARGRWRWQEIPKD